MPVRILTTQLQQKAIENLNEDSSKVQECIQSVKGWSANHSYLHIRADEQWLLNILRCCKFNLEDTKKRLECLCTLKTILPEFFKNRDPFLPGLQRLLEAGAILPLPKLSEPSAPRVLLLRCEPIDLNEHKIEDQIKLGLMTLDILINEDDNCIVSGMQIVCDNKGLTFMHALQPSLFGPKLYKCVHDAYALQPKGLFCLNTPAFANSLFKTHAPKAKKEYVDMVHFYNDDNWEEVKRYIPGEILPQEYGGNGGTIAEITAYWKSKVESYKDWFLKDSSYCSDESKRPVKLDIKEFFNVGPFKKVDVSELD